MIKPEVLVFAEEIYKSYEKELTTASLSEIEEGEKGAKENNNYIYIICGANNKVFYVGETRDKRGIKARFKYHGSKHKDKEFYPEITEIKFLEGNFNKSERLFLEGAFTMALKPSHMENQA